MTDTRAANPGKGKAAFLLLAGGGNPSAGASFDQRDGGNDLDDDRKPERPPKGATVDAIRNAAPIMAAKPSAERSKELQPRRANIETDFDAPGLFRGRSRQSERRDGKRKEPRATSKTTAKPRKEKNVVPSC